MLFNSHFFVFVFLPLVLCLWWSPRLSLRNRLVALVCASYFFYGWWDFRFVVLLFGSSLVDYQVGKRLHQSTSERTRGRWLLVSLGTNLGLLAFFKYSGFMAETINAVTHWLHQGGALPVPEIILPVGISFYTFQTLSYTIDIYRRKVQPANSWWHFAAYVSLFPQLIAGPIVRYSDIETQLSQIPARPPWNLFACGVYFFVMGLAQKILLADTIAERIGPLFSDYHSLAFSGAWYAMLGYTCQLYFDFSGYSNMAVGLGLMLGFQFPQNFDSPYKSKNISEFWRRWHISLSTFLRDYVFIPFGGSRGGRLMTARNLIIVMFLGGLWHGAGWTFVLWGMFHGILLASHSVWKGRFRLPQPVATAITFVAVVFGWTLFRSTDLAMCEYLWRSMLGLHGFDLVTFLAHDIKSILLLAMMLGIIFLLPNVWQIRFEPNWAWATGLSFLFVMCVMRFDNPSPFLYFQF